MPDLEADFLHSVQTHLFPVSITKARAELLKAFCLKASERRDVYFASNFGGRKGVMTWSGGSKPMKHESPSWLSSTVDWAPWHHALNRQQVALHLFFSL